MLNNRGVLKYLELLDVESQDCLDKAIKQTHDLFNLACTLDPKNQTALLNKYLFLWELGELRDDEFQFKNQTEIAKVDPLLSRLVYALFRRNIEGDQIKEPEMKQLIGDPLTQGKFAISRLASFILQGPDFIKYWPRMTLMQKKAKIEQQRFLKQVYKTKQPSNFQFEIESEDSQIQGFAFSNNESYLGIISNKKLVIVETSQGKEFYQMPLALDPKFIESQQHDTQSKNNGETEQTPEQNHQQQAINETPCIKIEQKQSPGCVKKEIHSAVINSALDSHTVTSDSEDNANDGNSPEQLSTTLNKPSSHLNSKKKRGTILIHLHQNHQFHSKNIKPKWLISISNNCKQLAVYDQNQQIRNFQSHGCKSDLMTVYHVQTSRSGFVPRTYFMLDLQSLLNKQELLSFDLNSDPCQHAGCMTYAHLPSCIIFILAKDLQVYHIRYDTHSVLTITTQKEHPLHSTLMTSPAANGDFPHRPIDRFKQFYQHQESLGHKVLLPKINQEIAVVKARGETLLKVYHVNKAKFVRKLKFEGQTTPFDQIVLEQRAKEAPESAGQTRDQRQAIDKASQRSRKSSILILDGPKNTQANLMQILQKFQRQNLLRKNTLQGNQSKKAQVEEWKLLEQTVKQTEETSSNQIDFLQISPMASFLVGKIGNQVVVRYLNQVKKSQYLCNYEYNKSIAFLPIYFDEDYIEPQQLQEGHLNSGTHEIAVFNVKNMIKDYSQTLNLQSKFILNNKETQKGKLATQQPIVTQKDMNSKLKLVEMLNQSKCTQFKKNEFLREMAKFVQLIHGDPQTVVMNLPQKKRKQNLFTCFYLLRSLFCFDNNLIELNGIKDLRPFITFEDFHFLRSWEEVKEFCCSQHPEQNLLGCFVGRQVHVYDFIQKKILFKANIPSISSDHFQVFNQNHHKQSRNIKFMDCDSIIMARTGTRQVHLLSILPWVNMYKLKQNRVKKTEDELGELEVPKFGHEIDVGFQRLPISSKQPDLFSRIDFKNGKSGGGMEEEDQLGEQQAIIDDYENAMRSIDVNFDIKGIYTSQGFRQFTALALVGDYHIMIYSVYELDQHGCEIEFHLELNFRTCPVLRSLGMATSFEFDDHCMTFSIGTSSGWICTYEYESKRHMQSYYVKNPIDPTKPESIDILRDFALPNYCICYCSNSEHLMFVVQQKMGHKCSDQFLEHDHENEEGYSQEMKSIMYPYDANANGSVQSLQLDSHNKYLVASFKNCAISIYFARTQVLLRTLNPHLDIPSTLAPSAPPPLSPPSSSPSSSTTLLFIDDLATYVASLDHHQRAVSVRTFEWDFECREKKKFEFKSVAQHHQQMKDQLRMLSLKSPGSIKGPQQVTKGTGSVVKERITSPLADNASKIYRKFLSPKVGKNDDNGNNTTIAKSQTCSIF